MTKVINRSKRILAIMGIAILLISMMGLTSFAAEFDQDKPITLTAVFQGDAQGIDGVTMKAYKVADMDAEANFTVTDEFYDYDIDFSALNDQGSWRALGETIAAYVDRDMIDPVKTAVTKDGKAEFGTVEPGLYVVIPSNPTVYDHKSFTVDISVVTAPLYIDGEWENECVFSPKYKYDNVPVPGTAGIEVIKIWGNQDLG